MIIVLFIFRQGWQRIYSLALFVEHMLLGVGELQLKLRPLVLEHTRRLAQVSPLTLLPQAENKLLKELFINTHLCAKGPGEELGPQEEAAV